MGGTTQQFRRLARINLDRYSGNGSGKAKFFRAGKAGGWRSALSQPQVAQLIQAHRQTLIEFGYLTDDGRPAP